VSNAGAQPGDSLVLSKPLGLGIVTTANKNDVDHRGAIGEAIRLMTTLNRGACEAMLEVGVHAATDITGFGLLGHLRNVCAASRVSARVWLDAVPVMDAARTYVAEGVAPGGTHANRRFLADWVTWGPGVTDEDQLLLCDAQTSGGLLMAVRAGRSDDLVAALEARGTACAAVIGTITDGPTGRMEVVAGA
jgi:selenide,water dikinase